MTCHRRRCKVVEVKGATMSNEIELSISCNDCVRRGTPDCADCLVSFVLGEEPDELVMTARRGRRRPTLHLPGHDAATEVSTPIDRRRIAVARGR